ncbi:sulfotransferase family protein [Kitasatospora mediocidica]|uniref:sulfotransferase family protein n=1 Tax=Kitasatospora mediocidica TaxID=58352 RepID=UPI00056BF00B|nr:sulfotransferase [Kitasatospora mediocidica]
MHTRKLTFVVGTGRCGSTALSQVVNLHPDMLSVNELFASVPGPQVLGDEPMSGTEFWGHLARPNPVADTMLRNGAPPPEFLYNRRPRGRYRVETTGIPAVSMMVLPHLTDDPDGLLDALEPEVSAWPVRSPARHWEAFFDALAVRFGDPGAVVERSGLSLGRVPQLRRLFPHARFVHLYRDGPDCALSMSRHVGFRLLLLMWEMADRCGLASPHELTAEHAATLPADLAPLLGERFDPALVLDRPMPLSVFGGLWSHLVVDGVDRLEEIPQSQRSTLRYEQLIADPRGELKRLADFAGVEADPRWLTAGAALLDGGRCGAALNLPADELAALRRSCEPGMRALARHGC